MSVAAKPVLTTAGESTNLDFLRSIAVLSVYAGHVLYTFALSSGDPSNEPDLGWYLGRFGVLVFFVHTSLVLMMSLERLQRDNRPLFSAFYLRRFFRIYPLSIACVGIIVLFRLPPGPHLPWFHPHPATVLANLSLTTNVFQKGNLTPVLWTLPLEVQMYILLPVIYLIGRKYRTAGISLLWLVAVVASYAEPHISSRLGIVHYIPCFLAGVASYFVGFSTSRKRLPFVGWPLAIAAAASFFYAFGSRNGYEVWWVMCLAIGLSAPFFADLKFSPLKKASTWVARYSYGIYLTHLYALWTAFIVLKDQPLWLRCAVVAALSAALPVLFYHLIEHPMLKLGARLANRLPAPASEIHWSDLRRAGWTRTLARSGRSRIRNLRYGDWLGRSHRLAL